MSSLLQHKAGILFHPKVIEMITAKSKITDCVLEPTDQTKFLVTLCNTHSQATARNVQACVSMKGGNPEGVELLPDDRCFGEIAPGHSVTKEFVIDTQRAKPCKRHDVQISLTYDYAMPAHECELVSFQIGKD